MRFIAKEPITHGTAAENVRRYEIGEELELTAEQAAAIPHAVEPAPAKKAEPADKSKK